MVLPVVEAIARFMRPHMRTVLNADEKQASPDPVLARKKNEETGGACLM